MNNAQAEKIKPEKHPFITGFVQACCLGLSRTRKNKIPAFFRTKILCLLIKMANFSWWGLV